MKRVKNLVLRSLAFLAIAYLSFVAAPAQDAPRPATQPDVKTNGRTHNLPQEL